MKLYELLILIVLVVAAACAAYYVLSGSDSGESQLVNPAPVERIHQSEDSADVSQAVLPPTSAADTDDSAVDTWVQPAGSDGQWRPNTSPGQLPQNF